MNELRANSRLVGIDMLRGIAILLVLAIHIPHDAPGGWRDNPWFFPAFFADFGYLGVPLFILISGFCIHAAAARNRAAGGGYGFDWAQFWKRRFVRLYPPYVAAMVLSLVFATWLHSKVADPASLLGWDLATHLLLVHNLTSEYATSLGNGAFWSLGTEEQLYALYALLLLLFTRFSGRTALFFVAGVTLAWRLVTPFWPDPGPSLGPFHLGQWFQWPLHYWLHWTLGAVAVDAYLGNRTLPAWTRSVPGAIAALALGLAFNRNTFEFLLSTQLPMTFLRTADAMTLAVLHNMGELMVLAGFFMLLNVVLRMERDGRLRGALLASLAWVGRISYSLYLVHVPVIHALEARMPFDGSEAHWPLRYAVYGTIVMLAGYAFHRLVERWFLNGRLPFFAPRAIASENAS